MNQAKMSTQQRKDWVASLKDGDMVAIEGDDQVYTVEMNYQGKPYVMGRALSITGCLPKGQSGDAHGKVLPATSEQVKGELARRVKYKLAYHVNWSEITSDQALAIAKILNMSSILEFGWPVAQRLPALTDKQNDALEALEEAIRADDVPTATMLDPCALIPTQDDLELSTLDGLAEAEYIPAILVIQKYKQLFIYDGHHRATRARLDKQHVRSVVFDADKE